MHELLENIFRTKQFINSNDQKVDVHSETSREQCAYLQQLISRHHFKHSLEIGFAFGISTLAIMEEIIKNGGTHLVIDKFQHEHWKGHGLDLVKQAGYQSRLEFREEFCYKVLPALLEKPERFDFVYIDSTKQLDWLLVDFFYIDKLLSIGGIIVFDDVNFPGIRKLLRYISQFPNYKVHSCHPGNAKLSASRSIASFLKYLPVSRKYIKEEILVSDAALGINAGAVALQKTGEDLRNWDWHTSF